MSISRRHLLAAGASLAALGPAACVSSYGSKTSYQSQIVKPENRNAVFYWVDAILQQTRDQRVAPPRAAYNFAMPMAAGFLAANAITQTYEEPFGIGPGPAGADPEVAYGAAFAVAAAEVFQQPFLFERVKFKKRYENDEAKSLGAEWGRKVGLSIVKMRTNDGSEPSEINYYLGRYPRRKDSLKWTPSAPYYSADPGPAFESFSRPLFPGQGDITPWTMTSGSQFRVPEFYDPASPEFAKEFDYIKKIGGADSTLRTADEAEIALYWEDGPWGVTPPGRFVYIAMQVMQDRGLSFIEMARAFALIGMTQCDASISAWDSKYTHDVLRPETAIRYRAPKFNNPDPRVVADRGWQSYIPTPEFPAYTSGHSTFGAVGVELIAGIIGTERVNFSQENPDQVIWPQLKGIRRSWTTLSQAAEENGLSRLYGGVHWKADHTQAMKAGRAIAKHALQTMFNKKA